MLTSITANLLKGSLVDWKKAQRDHEEMCREYYNACSQCVVKVGDQHLVSSPFILMSTVGDAEVVSVNEVDTSFTFPDEQEAQDEIDRVCKIGVSYRGRKYEIIPLTSYYQQVVNVIETEIDGLIRQSGS